MRKPIIQRTEEMYSADSIFEIIMKLFDHRSLSGTLRTVQFLPY